MYIEITYDTFDITSRIKNIDKNYFIRYNKKTSKYEVWLMCGVNAHLELILPFPYLDFRTIKKVLLSKVEKIDEIIKSMEEDNKRLENKQNEMLKNELEYKVKTILKY